ncbi:MAG: 2-phospho-L-lactate guanylyltransferase, partial [Chloroflexota bacterium]
IRRMARSVLESAITSGVVSEVLVVSPDPEALGFAAAFGTHVLPVRQREESRGLNAAIAQGEQLARERGAAALLVLFGDLPLLTPGDLRNLTRRDAPVVLAPDRHFTGTNALLLRLAALQPDGPRFTFRFGPDSYAKHVEEAHALGLEVATAFTAGTAFDLDTPEDLAAMVVPGETRTGLEPVSPDGAEQDDGVLMARGAGAW